jgi:formate dehydrogenase subunit gamma
MRNGRRSPGGRSDGGSSAGRYVRRFTLTERALHWVHAAAFFFLLATGLCLYIPALASDVGDRPLLKDLHFYTAISWMGAMLLIVAAGNRRALRATLREIDLFDRDDRRFLAGHTDSPQGRFNAGQKVNAIITAAFATLFFVSGMLLWLGERNTDIRLGGTLYLHDALMYISVVIVIGHLYLALINRGTRHSLRGMTLGSVREDWAQTHHAKWASVALGADTVAGPRQYADTAVDSEAAVEDSEAVDQPHVPPPHTT